jgi:hypothetical protein
MSGSENECSNLNSERIKREWKTPLEAAGFIPTWQTRLPNRVVDSQLVLL